jgi:hypothetical protein
MKRYFMYIGESQRIRGTQLNQFSVYTSDTYFPLTNETLLEWINFNFKYNVGLPENFIEIENIDHYIKYIKLWITSL